MPNEKKRGRPAGKSRCECQCVGYLTKEGLLWRLDTLVQTGVIGHYWAVEHEPDEEVHKVHWHLRMTPPPSVAVEWSKVCDQVQEMVEGENLPRKLVLGQKAVNDASLEGLLYARHDSRYLAAKGLVRATVDIPSDRFYTDSRDWFEELWNAADAFEVECKRLSKADILAMLDECHGRISNRVLLRLVLCNNYTLGDYQLFGRYCAEVRSEERIREEECTDETV